MYMTNDHNLPQRDCEYHSAGCIPTEGESRSFATTRENAKDTEKLALIVCQGIKV